MNFDDADDCPFDNLGGADTPPPTPPPSPPQQELTGAVPEPHSPDMTMNYEPSTPEQQVPPPAPPPPPPPFGGSGTTKPAVSSPTGSSQSLPNARPSVMETNPFESVADDPFADADGDPFAAEEEAFPSAPFVDSAPPEVRETNNFAPSMPPPPPPPPFGAPQKSPPQQHQPVSTSHPQQQPVRPPPPQPWSAQPSPSSSNGSAAPGYGWTPNAPPQNNYQQSRYEPTRQNNYPEPVPQQAYPQEQQAPRYEESARPEPKPQFGSYNPTQNRPAQESRLDTSINRSQYGHQRQASDGSIGTPLSSNSTSFPTTQPSSASKPTEFKPFVPYRSSSSTFGGSINRSPPTSNLVPNRQPEVAAYAESPSHLPSYHIRHSPAVAFGFGGSLIVGAGNRLVHHNVAQLLQSPARGLHSLPGPLETGCKTEVIQRSLQSVPRSQLRDLLSLLLQKPLDWHKDVSKIADLLELGADDSPIHPEYPHVPPEYMSEALQQIQQLVASGERHEAVRCAMHYKQYAHAMIIAMVCDKETYEGVVNQMISETMVPGAPLGTAYRVFSGIAGQPREDLSQWQSQVRILLTNDTPATAEELLEWGDALSETPNSVEAAHFCYLLAQLKPVGKSPNQAFLDKLKNKYALLGGVHRRERCRAALLSPHTVFQTEVLEHVFQRENSHYVRQSLLPFRVALAAMCFELGLTDKGNAYLEHLGKVLPSGTQKPKGDNYPRTLPQMLSHWRQLYTTSKTSTTGGGVTSAKWWPFGGSSAAGSSAKAGRSMTPNPTSSQKTVPTTSASSSFPKDAPNAATEKRSSSLKQNDSTGNADDNAKKTAGGWSSWFRRNKKDEPKQMILDSDPVEFDSSTGTFKFERTEEEKAIEKQIKAGPPKMPAKSPTTSTGPPTPSPQSPAMPPGPRPGGPPPPGPPPRAGGAPAANRYVDMFNSS